MKSIRELYRIGTGPSSSHTMGPRKAAEIFLGKHPEAKAFQVTLYGSLAATGKGHMTDVAILDTLQPHAPTEIIWKAHVFYPFHPNGMTFKSLNEKGKVTDEWTVFSVGGVEPLSCPSSARAPPPTLKTVHSSVTFPFSFKDLKVIPLG